MRPTAIRVAPVAPIAGALLWIAPLFGQEPARPSGLPGDSARTAIPDPAPPAVSADSADRLRTALIRPPGRPPPDIHDLLSLPLRLAALPLLGVGYGIRGVLSLVARPDRPPNPIVAGLRDARRWGLYPRPRAFGPRGGPGAAVRLDRYRPLVLESGLSLRGSQVHSAALYLATPGEGVEVSVEGSFERYAEPHFWGIGPRSRREDAADYRWDRMEARSRAAARTGPARWSAEVAWEENRVRRGFDGSKPDLQDVASADTLFGLAETTRFVRVGGALLLDGMRWLEFQPRGVRAQFGGTAYVGVGGTSSDFLRWRAALTGHLPLNPRQELSLNGRLEVRRPRGASKLPFTHLASLGGGPGGRGFARDRFRDRDVVALASEWRYEIWRNIHDDLRQEAFVFFDLGSVAHRITDLQASDLRSSYGFGLRTVAPQDLWFGWYLGFSAEDTHFRLEFSWPF